MGPNVVLHYKCLFVILKVVMAMIAYVEEGSYFLFVQLMLCISFPQICYENSWFSLKIHSFLTHSYEKLVYFSV